MGLAAGKALSKTEMPWTSSGKNQGQGVLDLPGRLGRDRLAEVGKAFRVWGTA